MKYKCSGCGETFEDSDRELRFCPSCGSKLVPQEETPSGFSFGMNLGDANAISGGIHASSTTNNDSHDIHNVDSHNVTNNYVNQYERQKTDSELNDEKRRTFTAFFKECCPSGTISSNDLIKLQQKAWSLNLPMDQAEEIIQMEREFLLRSVNQLQETDLQLLSALESALEEANESMVIELYPYIVSLHEKSSDERVEFYHYLLLAALEPDRLLNVNVPGQLSGDSFWQYFWKGQILRVRSRQEESLSCLSHLKFLARDDKRKLLLLECLDNATKPVEMTFFRKTSQNQFQQLIQITKDFTLPLVRSIGYYLGVDTNLTGIQFYVKHFFSEHLAKEQEGPFVLPKMIKINPL